MKNGKYTRRSSGMKVTSVLLAALLLVGCSIGATLAWMTAQSSEVKNTFTVGNIQIELWEHKYDPETNTLKTGENDELVKANDNYPLTPGKNMPKDPFVTVKAGSEKCWLFVAIKEDNNPDLGRGNNVVQYNVNEASGSNGRWNALNGDGLSFEDGYTVYYCVQEAVAKDTNVNILKRFADCNDLGHANGCVEVNQNVTSDNVTDPPTLTFTAAAIQYDGLEPVGEATESYNPELDAAIRAFNNLPDDFKDAVLEPPITDDPET